MAVQVPYNYAVAITKSDTVNIVGPADVPVYGVYVGGTGNIVAVFADGSTATFKGIPAGTILPISLVRVNDTSTSASDMLALYKV